MIPPPASPPTPRFIFANNIEQCSLAWHRDGSHNDRTKARSNLCCENSLGLILILNRRRVCHPEQYVSSADHESVAQICNLSVSL